jgi:HD-like signal output (HDOD) protein
MPDDFFGSRFKPGVAGRPLGGDDDSGFNYRSQTHMADRPSENEILAAVDGLPSLPAVVSQILAMVGDAHSSAADLDALIRQDMVLAARLLKLVNSPFYGLIHPVLSIPQAVSIIGFASLKSLVLAASTSNLLVVDVSSYGFADQGLWRNSIATAAVARAIAQRTGVSKDDAEGYFVAGLLRDIGMLVLGPMLAQRKVRLHARDGDSDLLTYERQVIGFDHCWVGERVAERWKLPESLRMAIARHHRIPATASQADLRLLAGVRLAERLVYASATGLLPDHPFDHRIDGTLVQATGLDGAGFQRLAGEIPRLIANTANAGL